MITLKTNTHNNISEKSQFQIEDLNAPIANLDIEDWLDLITNDDKLDNNNNKSKPDSTPEPKVLTDTTNENKSNKPINNKPSSCKLNSNLVESIDLCNSLEDLVKTFDQNVKECFVNYKNIDIGQLAPVQIRSQEDIINDSQMWYTLTGNFGNLLPIDYWSKSLVRKYHNNSLNLTRKKSNHNVNSNLASEAVKKDDFLKEKSELNEDSVTIKEGGLDSDLNMDSYENMFDEEESNGTDEDDEDFDGYDEEYDDEEEEDKDELDCGLDYDDDEEELKEQLDMHSMILSKSVYNDNDLDEPLITAEQVLNEIDSMMTMQEELCDEMTPDSGCFSTNGLNSSVCSNYDLPLDINGSYVKYINTFALLDSNENESGESEDLNQFDLSFIPEKKELEKLNVFQLNELIEQVETVNKELSETLVQEFALKDELEFEKETRNTFISLLMSIQEKRRQLNLETLNSRSLTSTCKKKNRKSLISLSTEASSSTHLTTVIPYNGGIEYTVQHLQILNKLLRAINEDSHQVPELLTNYILKVVCPT